MAYTAEQAREYSKGWRKAHPGYSSQWEKGHPAAIKIARARSKYMMTVAEHSRMLNEQKHRCKLCRILFTTYHEDRTKSPNVDHSHLCPNKENHSQTGEAGGCPECIRGILCHICNIIVVRFLELYPNRQRAAERAYMADRPILRYRAEEQL